MRIVVAMSGGVDSSVAAALLAEQGHDVVGVSMQLYPSGGAARDGSVVERAYGTCCTLDDLQDARRVAHAIGIPHYIVNFESRFDEAVVANFVQEYVSGRTPIPCAHCNSDLKFDALLERASGLGAAALATGHYARISRDDDGVYHLRRGLDPGKDQSYFLFSLTQAQMGQARFPIGELDKPTVREHARRLGLRVADKPDSQEICFVPDGDYAAFVEREAPALTRSGVIVSSEGRVLGTHEGVHRFTIGQRKGLRLSSSAPLYVTAIDADAARVTVGTRDALDRDRLAATGVSWTSGVAPDAWRPAQAQIRHRHTAAPGRVRATDDGAEFIFDAPQSAITPGQAVVFYEEDELIGGGWIR
ncbi:MAG: tRNA 2-thiouridine(34) synthase MnmA [Acidobacteria bacterium]|nr:tRNA 2-thiouridine(34) synthase MnmA [Acidobacteriota bacterium]